MKSGFKDENQNLNNGDFTEVNVTYRGIHSEDRRRKKKKKMGKKRMAFMYF